MEPIYTEEKLLFILNPNLAGCPVFYLATLLVGGRREGSYYTGRLAKPVPFGTHSRVCNPSPGVCPRYRKQSSAAALLSVTEGSLRNH